MLSCCIDHRMQLSSKAAFFYLNELKYRLEGSISDKQHYISQRKLLLSRDIELNPGPVQNSILTSRSSNVALEQRLGCFQLRPFDVGGDGDCFFEQCLISYMVTLSTT